ncbi:transcription factor E2F8-like [Neodiprion pinetum]|uniref:transcription factor E2F8-like n=1 Tax=Neodiprion pinetum TaxID=441929 RepID=UPI001EDFB99D|nr:transcription factor E2F8-like [Neodiprion pinetum]
MENQAMDTSTKESPDRRVLRELSNVKSEPVSPTANLRLLTTLASSLKSAPHNQSKIVRRTWTVSRDGDTDPLKLLPRKEKSLGLLCNKFLSLYPLTTAGGMPQEISLDTTAKALGTEKRRIYDIINVLESLEMASKAGKNRYLWHGHNYLPGTLAKLKSLAVKLGLREQIQDIQKINRAYTANFNNESPFLSTVVSQPTSADNNSLIETNAKEDKSLGVMCQKFIMLFLVSLKNGIINLDMAAKVLITDSEQSIETTDTSVRSRFKTKVRRLYDIANVLSAIGLIRKVSMSDSSIRKPVFQYTGPDVDYIDFDEETPVREGTRHSLIGMATPNRSLGPSVFLQSSSTKPSPCHNRLLIGSTTPVNQRRELRKRKLFGTDEKFGRTMSSPCLDNDRPSERLDDSILQVAEMELERLKSSEQPAKSKVCVKLFPRHNSESCVTATQVSGELNNIFEGLRSLESGLVKSLDSKPINEASDVSSSNAIDTLINGATGHKTLMTASNVNLVDIAAFNASSSIEVPSFNSSSHVNHPSSKNQIPTVHLSFTDTNLQAKINNVNTKPLKLKVRNPNIITVKNVSSNNFTVKNLSSDNTRTVRLTPYKIQPKTCGPKFVNLARIGPKKLIPIKPSDLSIASPSLRSVVIENPSLSNTSYAILTQVQTPIVSPGDILKAVQVGNTLQLVPLCNQTTINFTNEINSETSTNRS